MIDLSGDNAGRFGARDLDARAWHASNVGVELNLLFDCLAAFEQLLRRVAVLPPAPDAADTVLHELLPDAYQALRAGATLIASGLYQPALRMARPLSDQWAFVLYLTEHRDSASRWLEAGEYPKAGKLLSQLQRSAEQASDSKRVALLEHVCGLRSEENALQHVGRVASAAGTRLAEGEQIAMLGSGRSDHHVKIATANLIRWVPALLAAALTLSRSSDPRDEPTLQALYRRVEEWLPKNS